MEYSKSDKVVPCAIILSEWGKYCEQTKNTDLS